MHASVTNIGSRPTFDQVGTRVETHILDFSRNIYDEGVSLRFRAKIRDERRFASPEELSARIREDLLAARRHFSRHPLPPSS
jgi:riboflavin kinase/FMN adenylyltransferase